MQVRPAAALATLERKRFEYGSGAAEHKLALLRVLDAGRLARSLEVVRLHEALCFLRAYPDDAAVLAQVEAMLDRFERRADLARHRAALAGTGIAGTATPYRFYAQTASWLARRHGRALMVDWAELGDGAALEPLLPLFALYAETPGLDGLSLSAREWIDRMKGPRESDAEFLIRRFEALRMDPAAREMLFESIDVPFVLAPHPNGPSRTRAKLATARVAFRTEPLRRDRPSLTLQIARPPRAVRPAMPSEAREIVDLARAMMVTLNRDLDVFSYGSEEDVRIAECEDGLTFAFIGFIPERRLLLEALYGYLILQNGVPIGYGTVASLFESSEVAYNVSETFRGGEAAHVFGRLLACARALFGAQTFYLDPYQIGDENEEALATGAWWFYQKLGFRSRDRSVLRRMDDELRRMRRSPRHRSTPAALRALASAGVFLHAGAPREDVLGSLSLERVGLHVTDFAAERFGAERERAATACLAETVRLTGVRLTTGSSAGERLALDRWAPLVCVLPGVARWTASDRRALAEVILAKGGPRESDYVARFDRHAPLRAAIVALASAPVSRARAALKKSRPTGPSSR